MSWQPIILKGISYLSQSKEPAFLEFERGLNVICGATDSGKSFILETIDFMLASSYPIKLRDINELVDYDRVRLLIETGDKNLTFERPAVTNSRFLVFSGNYLTEVPKVFGLNLHANPYTPRENSVSKILLEAIGLSDKYLQTNKDGETKALGFRQLVPFILINEEKIIKAASPILGDEFIYHTRDYSTFKLLLTGIDDSALRSVELQPVTTPTDIESNITKSALIEELIRDLDLELEEDGRNQENLEERLNEINQLIVNQTVLVQENQQKLNLLNEERRAVVKEKNELTERIDELTGLFARFEILQKHYQVDLERLAAIVESGSVFVHLSKTPCPLCGSSVSEQHLEEQCDGNVEEVIIAAQSESQKVKRLLQELEQTIIDLNLEYNVLEQKKFHSINNIGELDLRINQLSLPLENLQISFHDLLEESVQIRGLLDKFARRDELEQKRQTLLKNFDQSSSNISVDSSVQVNISTPSEIPMSILDKFSVKVRTLLQNWHFPDSERVYFDVKSKDFVINGKLRGNRGKGLRAVAQAAITIGLMEFCRDNNLPHPGFVVLDSPLLGYYKPDGDDDSLKGTDLKERFYEYLATNHQDCQIIIIENEVPPEKLSQIKVTYFTKNPRKERYGFFPKP